MKINGRGITGYSASELVNVLRRNPHVDLGAVTVLDPEQHNNAVTEMFSDLGILQTWQDSAWDTAWHQQQQNIWLMPQHYQDLDIAQILLSRCEGPAELQRMAEELLMFQDRDLLPMLNYLHYLVETLAAHQVVLGVGRGSSVASFALYKLGVHRVNSLYYDLDIREFLK